MPYNILSSKIIVKTIPSWGYCVHKSYLEGITYYDTSNLNFEGCGEYEFDSKTTISEMLNTLYKSHSVECPEDCLNAHIIFIQQKINVPPERFTNYCPDEYAAEQMRWYREIQCCIKPTDELITNYFKDKDPVIYVHTRIYSRGRSDSCCIS